MSDTDITMRDTDVAVKDIQQRVDYTSQDLNALLLQAGLIAGDVRRTEQLQQKYWLKVGPRTIALLDHSDQLLTQVRHDEGDVSTSLVGVLDAAHQTLDSGNDLLADPDMKRLLTNLSATAENTASTTKHLEATAQNFQHSSASLDKKLDEMLRPRSLIKSIFLTVLRVAADLGTVYKSY